MWVGTGGYMYYDNWDFGEPSNSGPRNENCLAMESSGERRWNDIDCYATNPDELKRPICQIFG